MRFFTKTATLFEGKNGNTLVQVLQRGNKRELRFGNYITQSAILEDDSDHLLLEYTKGMIAGFIFKPDANRILHIGLGAGSMPRFIHTHFPKTRQTVVEINPDVIQAAYDFFFLPRSKRLQVIEGDGISFVQTLEKKFDLIFLDAFLADGAPDAVNSETFLEKLSQSLTPKGWLVNNIWGSDTENLNLVRGRLSRAFRQVYLLPIGAESNVIAFAGNGGRVKSRDWFFEKAHLLTKTVPIDFLRLFDRISLTYYEK